MDSTLRRFLARPDTPDTAGAGGAGSDTAGPGWVEAEQTWRQWADQLAAHLEAFPRELLERDRKALGAAVHGTGVLAAHDLQKAVVQVDGIARWYQRAIERDHLGARPDTTRVF